MNIIKLTVCIIFLLSFLGCQTIEQKTCLDLQQEIYSIEKQQPSLNLRDYQVVIDKKTITGINGNFSALTWNPETQTLFGTLNKPPTVVEISPTGDLLRAIKTKGIRDPEAIEYIGNNQFIIADERHHKLLKVVIDKKTTLLDGYQAPQIILGEIIKYNKGLEGLAYDSRNQLIYVANEAYPITIFEVTGFTILNSDRVNIKQNIDRDKQLFVKDISGLHFYESYQHLLLLSDESKLILELNKAGQIVGCLPLIAGKHGLLSSVPQAEGITMDDQDNLYVASEPNLFYVFKKAK